MILSNICTLIFSYSSDIPIVLCRFFSTSWGFFFVFGCDDGCNKAGGETSIFLVSMNCDAEKGGL